MTIDWQAFDRLMQAYALAVAGSDVIGIANARAAIVDFVMATAVGQQDEAQIVALKEQAERADRRAERIAADAKADVEGAIQERQAHQKRTLGWVDFSYEIGEALNCLPSISPWNNQHMVRAIRAMRDERDAYRGAFSDLRRLQPFIVGQTHGTSTPMLPRDYVTRIIDEAEAAVLRSFPTPEPDPQEKRDA